MDIMDINFDDVIQLLEADFQDFQNENKKSFITIITLPLIKRRNNLSSLLDVFDCLHIQTIYRSINVNQDGQSVQSVKLDKSVEPTTIQSKEHLFLALRNVEIKKEYQQQGICTKLSPQCWCRVSGGWRWPCSSRDWAPPPHWRRSRR